MSLAGPAPLGTPTQLDRVEAKLDALAIKLNHLLRALAEDDPEDEDLLTLDGGLAGAERDTSKPL